MKTQGESGADSMICARSFPSPAAPKDQYQILTAVTARQTALLCCNCRSCYVCCSCCGVLLQWSL